MSALRLLAAALALFAQAAPPEPAAAASQLDSEGAHQSPARLPPARLPIGGWTDNVEGVETFVLSADGNLALLGSAHGYCVLYDFAAGSAEWIDSPAEEAVITAAFAPDGSRVAFGTEGGSVVFIELDVAGQPGTAAKLGRGIAETVHVGDAMVEALAFSPDGSRLAVGAIHELGGVIEEDGGETYIDYESWLVILEAPSSGSAPDPPSDLPSDPPSDAPSDPTGLGSESRSAQKESQTLSYWITDLAWSPDGSVLAISDETEDVAFFELKPGAFKEMWTAPEPIEALAWSPDGLTLACGGAMGWLYLVDYPSREVRHELEGHLAEVFDLAFTADGERLVSGSGDNTARIWNPTSGELVAELVAHVALVTSVAVNAETGLVYTAGYDETVHVWSLGGDELETNFEPAIELVELEGSGLSLELPWGLYEGERDPEGFEEGAYGASWSTRDEALNIALERYPTEFTDLDAYLKQFEAELEQAGWSSEGGELAVQMLERDGRSWLRIDRQAAFEEDAEMHELVYVSLQDGHLIEFQALVWDFSWPAVSARIEACTRSIRVSKR